MCTATIRPLEVQHGATVVQIIREKCQWGNQTGGIHKKNTKVEGELVGKATECDPVTTLICPCRASSNRSAA